VWAKAIWFIGSEQNVTANEKDDGTILVSSSGAGRIGRWKREIDNV
jgi:hypothetical protein